MNYHIDTTKEELNSTGRIALVGKLCERIGFATASLSVSRPEILRSLVGLLAQGQTR